MNKKNIRILTNEVETRFLPAVRRPARYIGGEVNQIKKDLAACALTVGLCFPDTYEIGMSYTGLSVLYELINATPDYAAERVFTPALDAEKVLREEHIPLFSLESRAAIADFDILGFSLTTELCYTNVLTMLDLAGIPLRAADRTADHPIIIGGGQGANIAEPIAPFFDLFVLGDGEKTVPEILSFFRAKKAESLPRAETLTQAAQKFDYVYVPSLYEPNYTDHKYTGLTTKRGQTPFTPSNAPKNGETENKGQSPINLNKRGQTPLSAHPHIENAIIDDFENAPLPQKPIVPHAQAIHERVSIEVMRGCPGSCRFCQASFCKDPVRHRSVDTIVAAAKANYHATGFDTVSLLSLSTADYPHLEELVDRLREYFEPHRVGISVPSLRVQQQLKILPRLVTSVRKSGLTIAVEAANDRMRKIINKHITDADLFAAVEAAYRAGFEKLKLYFMVGFPGETQKDIEEIVHLCKSLARLRRKVEGKTANINAAVSWFVPKAHTPFGYLPQKPREYFHDAKKLILDKKFELKAKYINFKFHDIDASALESAMGRADRRLADVIETAWRNGARFDLWSDSFAPLIWENAFKAHNLDLDTAAQRAFTPEDILPWQHLGGPPREHLQKHYNRAMELANQP
ncbi:(dimethylallyl)adenosine tRNA methylthiotransferase [Anaerohalosphaera lusitana]|uniref:(Dimethylallyl)adenosine tRNA methylthiotransferase n=1 Tax=Anaerohalosphaera lusitana TaxID=1936003 RepID=A0A1U9NS36_9BACT|nr:radical SAM protein [Anaerohalosphaera lusitana]AQT70326.1 (dimethylallyl)adenosine tRNA methylthiotransferase [Anaerohalosphaera lusitana]